MARFVLPEKPEDLLETGEGDTLRVQSGVDVSGLGKKELDALVEEAVHALATGESASVLEQDVFDQVFSLVQGFLYLSPDQRSRFFDCLCTSLSVLGASCPVALSGAPSAGRDAVNEHADVLQVHVMLLTWAAAQCEEEHSKAQAAEAPAANKRGKKKAVAHAGWDWQLTRDKSARSLTTAAAVDLWALFSPERPPERLLARLLHAGMDLLRSPEAMKSVECRESAFAVVSALAARYQMVEPISAALFDLVSKHEHAAPVVAQLSAYANRCYEDPGLGLAVLNLVCEVDPREYKKQQLADSSGVRNVATFIQELATLMPKAMCTNMALLVPHLGGESYTIRSAVVSAMAAVLWGIDEDRRLKEQHVAEGLPVPETTTAQAVARTRTVQHLLESLMARTRDSSAYTRARTMAAWGMLAKQHCIPISHWVEVATLALARVHDKASNVRRAALQCLAEMVLNNPFGRNLHLAMLEGALATHADTLARLEEVNKTADDLLRAEPFKAAEGEAGADGREGAEDDDVAMGTPGPKAGFPEPEEKPAVGNSAQRERRDAPTAEGDAELQRERAIVASLKTAVDFVKRLAAGMALAADLLASGTTSDVTEAITFIVLAKSFDIEGAQEAAKRTLPLVFSREQAVKEAVIEAFQHMFLCPPTPAAGAPLSAVEASMSVARGLCSLAGAATVGELAALESVLQGVAAKGGVGNNVLASLWEVALRVREPVAARNAMCVISLLASSAPGMAATQMEALLRAGFGHPDALLMRHACVALYHVGRAMPHNAPPGGPAPAAPAGSSAAAAPPALERDEIPSPEVLQSAYKCLSRVVVNAGLADEGWFTACEAAIRALYALHPRPESVACSLIVHMHGECLPAEGDVETASASKLSRFLFLISHVALQHLLYCESQVTRVRAARLARDRQAADSAAEAAVEKAGPRGKAKATKGEASDDEDDIAAQVGVGAVAEDAELDALKDAVEQEIIGTRGLLGRYRPLVSALCQDAALTRAPPGLRSSALLALCKMMALDAEFCEANIGVVFKALGHHGESPELHKTLVVAAGDLAFRFPNVLEPYTDYIYMPLKNGNLGVRRTSLMVLTHLILNDMLKVKGNIAKMALLLTDDDDMLRPQAQLFFHELAKKSVKNTNPIYNLLPDILSVLGEEQGLTVDDFRRILAFLLQFISKDQHLHGLVEKLCLRMGQTHQPRKWRDLAFCLSQLPLSDKGLRKLTEHFGHYQEALSDEEVLHHFNATVTKAKKSATKPEVREAIEEFEAKLQEHACERREQEEVARAAEAHRAQRAGANAGSSEEASGDAEGEREGAVGARDGKEGGEEAVAAAVASDGRSDADMDGSADDSISSEAFYCDEEADE